MKRILTCGMGSLQNLTRGGLSSVTVSAHGVLSQQQHQQQLNFGFGSSSNTSRGVSPTEQERNTPSFSRPPPTIHQRLNSQQTSSSSSNFATGSNFGGMSLMQSNSVTSPSVMAHQRSSLFNRNDLLSPNAFDPSEFPSLGQNSAPNPSLSARPNYVGMVKQPAMESSEFTMSNEDFPALPGSSSNNNVGSNLDHPQPFGQQQPQHDRMTSQGLHQENPNVGVGCAVSQTSAGNNSDPMRKGIQTLTDGTVLNIPPSMVTDQFGMIGLLTFIRAAETDPNLVSLALGADLTTLGLNLNSEVNLYPTFGGPWAETPCRPQDIDFHVPHEYLINQSIREKLAPVKLNRYKDDVLFYMFYTNVGDVLQLAAAAELYNRDWRYHREDRVWITRAPGMAPTEKSLTYERGTYYFFDVASWGKVPKDFYLEYDKLEDRPSLPSNHVGGSNTVPSAPSNQAANMSISPTTAISTQQDNSVSTGTRSPTMGMSGIQTGPPPF